MIGSSFALYCLNSLSIFDSVSSYGWPSFLSFEFLKTWSRSCSTHIRAFALIPCMEYDVVFPSMFVKSFVLSFIEDCSSCATHSAAFFRNCSFLARGCFAVSSSTSACLKKNCSSSAISGGCRDLNGCCLYIFPDLETDLLRDFQF